MQREITSVSSKVPTETQYPLLVLPSDQCYYQDNRKYGQLQKFFMKIFLKSEQVMVEA